MRWYFQLQVKMLNRHFKDFGVPLLIAYPLIIFLFILFSSIIFNMLEIQYALYVYFFCALSVLVKLSEKKRNHFLKLGYIKRKYYKLRALENSLILTPFVFYLIFKGAYLYIVLLYISGLLLSRFIVSTPSNFVIPTPFWKKPFEFSVGFRKTFYVYPFIYWLTYKSIEIDNFNLGVFSMIVLFLTLISYYTKMEKEYYVWIFNKKAKEFLLEKIKIGLMYALLLSAPIFIALLSFKDYIAITIVYFLLCFIYLIQAIIAKYVDFPKQINLPSSMIYTLSLAFPFFILFTFQYFYKKSIQKLKSILNDKHQ